MSITQVAVEPPAVGCALRARARELRRAMAELVGAVDGAAASGSLDGVDAAALAAGFAEIERLAAAGTTVAAGRVAATGQYRALGFPTAARWLAEISGLGVAAAGRVVATAAFLDDAELAATRAAFVGGSLTAAQAEEVARTAAAAPEEEPRLLALAARETTKRLREECRRVRLAGAPPDDPKKRAERFAKEAAFGTRDLGNGMGELFARMPTTALVLVMAAVREQCDAIFERAREEGRTDPHAAYLVEALVTLLLLGDLTGTGSRAGGGDAAGGGEAAGEDDDGAGEVARDGEEARGGDGEDETRGEAGLDGPDARTGFYDPLYRQLRASLSGDPPPAVPGRAARRRLRRGRCCCGGRVVPRAKIIVRVDQSALLRGWASGVETCDIAGVGPVPVATVRELWPDAVVNLVITRGVDVINVTSLSRRATEAIATAMQWGSVRCSNIACDNDEFVQVDHRLGWANVHRTRVDELDRLCSDCHRWKTNDNWQLVRGTGRRRFVPPDDPDHPGDPPTPRRRG